VRGARNKRRRSRVPDGALETEQGCLALPRRQNPGNRIRSSRHGAGTVVARDRRVSPDRIALPAHRLAATRNPFAVAVEHGVLLPPAPQHRPRR
jgi:hypothetical protein